MSSANPPHHEKCSPTRIPPPSPRFAFSPLRRFRFSPVRPQPLVYRPPRSLPREVRWSYSTGQRFCFQRFSLSPASAHQYPTPSGNARMNNNIAAVPRIRHSTPAKLNFIAKPALMAPNTFHGRPRQCHDTFTPDFGSCRCSSIPPNPLPGNACFFPATPRQRHPTAIIPAFRFVATRKQFPRQCLRP